MVVGGAGSTREGIGGGPRRTVGGLGSVEEPLGRAGMDGGVGRGLVVVTGVTDRTGSEIGVASLTDDLGDSKSSTNS